jgi:hypothetical protein
MSSKQILVAAAVAALVTPSFADIPDGQGGRTSPQARVASASPASVKACQRACPRRAAVDPRDVATTPAEIKALGHLAWMRTSAPRQEQPCNKKPAVRTVPYRSPAELKAAGYLARRDSTGAATQGCCEAGRCHARTAAAATTACCAGDCDACCTAGSCRRMPVS